MPLTAAQIFGADVSLDESTAGDPKLVIRLQNLQNSGTGAGQITDETGLDDVGLITAETLNSYSHRILVGLLKLHLKNQPVDNNDPTLGTYVEFDPLSDKAFTTRNDVSQVEFDITVLAYIEDTLTQLDPDNVKNA